MSVDQDLRLLSVVIVPTTLVERGGNHCAYISGYACLN